MYLYKDAEGNIIYVGKAKSLRARVRSYFNDDRLAEAKTGTLIGQARDVDYILVDNEKESLALEKTTSSSSTSRATTWCCCATIKRIRTSS